MCDLRAIARTPTLSLLTAVLLHRFHLRWCPEGALGLDRLRARNTSCLRAYSVRSKPSIRRRSPWLDEAAIAKAGIYVPLMPPGRM
jgi:hypothetical protein